MSTILSVFDHTSRERQVIIPKDAQCLEPFLKQDQLLDKLELFLSSRRGLTDCPPHLGTNTLLEYNNGDPTRHMRVYLVKRFEPGQVALFNEVT